MNFTAAIQAAIGTDTSGVQKGGKEVETAAAKMTSALAQIGVGLSFGAVLGFFKSVADQAGKVQDLSDRLNVGTDALQAFAYHAKQAGADGDGASMLFDKARKSVDQLAAGEEAATKAFAALHLSQKDLLGLPLEEKVEKIAKAYSAAKGEAGAYDAVTDILGAKSAPRLLAVITQLADQGLPAFTQAARDAGQVIESDTIAKLDELGDRLETLKGAATTAGAWIADKFIKLGEGIGYAAANIANSFDGIQSGWEISAATAKKAADATEGATAKLAEHLAKATDLAKLEDARFKAVVDSLKPLEAANTLEARAVELRRQAANAGKGSAEWAAKEREAIEKLTEASRIRSQEREKSDKAALELEDQAIEYAKQHAEQRELEAKLVTGTITPQEKLRLDILRLQTKELELQQNLKILLDKSPKDWNDAEKQLFLNLQRQTKEVQTQLDAKQALIAAGNSQVSVEKAVAEEIHYGTSALKSFVEEWTGWQSAVKTVGRGDNELSDRELSRKRQNLKDDIFARQVGLNGHDESYDPFLAGQRYALAQLDSEETLRKNVRDAVATFGEDRAFGMFQLTEQRFRDIIQGIDTSSQGRIADGLDKLNKRLDAGVPTVIGGSGGG